MDLSLWQWALLGFVVVFFGVAKGGFGAGIGFLATPLLALSLPPALAVGLLAPLLVFADALNLRLFWRQWSWSHVWALVPGMLVGVGLGWALFSLVQPNVLRALIGLMALVVALDTLNKFRGGQVRVWPTWSGHLFGAATGLSSTIAHAGGPPANAYLLPFGLEKRTYQATTVLVFAIVNLVKLPPYLQIGVVTASTIWVSLAFVPLVWLGIYLGAWLHTRIPQRPFYIFALIALAGSGLSLLIRGVSAWL